LRAVSLHDRLLDDALAISAVGPPGAPHRNGAAATHSDTWLHVYAAARVALLAGELEGRRLHVDDDQPHRVLQPRP